MQPPFRNIFINAVILPHPAGSVKRGKIKMPEEITGVPPSRTPVIQYVLFWSSFTECLDVFVCFLPAQHIQQTLGTAHAHIEHHLVVRIVEVVDVFQDHDGRIQALEGVNRAETAGIIMSTCGPLIEAALSKHR